MGISRKKTKDKKQNIGISLKLRLIEYAVFVLILALCIVHGVKINTSVSYAGQSDKLTLEDYLSSGEQNIFTEQLQGYKSDIFRLDETLEKLGGIEEKFQKTHLSHGEAYFDIMNLTHVMPSEFYVYSGEEFVIPYTHPFYEDYVAYLSAIDGYSDFFTSDGIAINYGACFSEKAKEYVVGLVDFTIELRGLTQDKYDELAMIYGGFAVVGYNAGKGFTVEVAKNELFDENEWGVLNESLYGEGVKVEAVEDEESKPSAVEKYIAKPIGNGAWTLYKWMYKWDIDLTIDGLVYGRMASSYKGTADFTHFGLENNNPYGIVGATAYYVLRRIFLGVMPISLIIMLIIQLLKNTNKGRAQLKDMAQSFLLVTALMFAFPYALNFVIYIRDVVLKATSVGMTTIFKGIGLDGFSVGGSIIGMLYSVYASSQTFLNAMLLAAGVGSGFFYFATYIKAAVLITGCFALLPLILFLSIWNRKLIKDWWNIFFPNMCVPLIDLILLQIPTVVLLVYRMVGGSGSIVIGILLMVIMWISLSVRERIVKLLGFDGFGGRNGFGMLAGLMMAMRQMGQHRGNRDGNRVGAPVGESFLNERDAEKESLLFSQKRQGIMEQARGDLFDIPVGEAMSVEYGLGNRTDRFLAEMDNYVSGYGGDAVSSVASPMEEPSDSYVPPSGIQSESYDLPEDSEAVMGSLSMEQLAEPVEDITPFDSGYVMGEEVRPREENFSFVEGFNGDAQSYYQPEVSPSYQPIVRDMPLREDADFRKSLINPADVDRYDNLTKMDAYRHEIAKNEATMQNAGYRRESYETERAGYMEQIGRLNRHIDESGVRLSEMSEAGSLKYVAEQQKLTDSLALKRDLNSRVEQLDYAAGLDRANAMYRQNVSDCMEREKRYAQNAGYGGMKNTVYESGRDFMYERKVDNAKRELANFKNFDTKGYEGLLSHQERERFYREREMYKRKQRLVAFAAGGAANVAVGAAGLVGAGAVGALSAYGGSSASSMAMTGVAKGTSAAGRYVSNKVSKAGTHILDRSMERRADKEIQMLNIEAIQYQRAMNSAPMSEPVISVYNHGVQNMRTSEKEILRMLRQRAAQGEYGGAESSEERIRRIRRQLGEGARKGENDVKEE